MEAARAEAERVRLTGAAEARAIEAVGRAEAEKMRMKASAYKQYGDAAVMALVLEALPQVTLPNCPFIRGHFVVIRSHTLFAIAPPKLSWETFFMFFIEPRHWISHREFSSLNKNAMLTKSRLVLGNLLLSVDNNSSFPKTMPYPRTKFQIAAEVAAPLAKTDEIVLLGGADRTTTEVNKLLGQLPPAVQALTGVDLSGVRNAEA